MKLNSAKAVVTGGASGLGRAVVEAIARGGGNAAILDLDQEAGKARAASLGKHVVYLATDVTSDASVDAAVAGAAEAFGYIDLAVSCAGIAHSQRVLGREGPMESAAFQGIMEVNLVGTFRVCRAAATLMQTNEPDADGQRGVIVNTASVAAFEGQVGQVAYAASKGGIASITLPLAREFARFGIRVVTIAPGVFDTPLAAGLPEKARAVLSGAQVFPQRFGAPSEFASLVQQIYENPMHNGAIIRLDGASRLP